MNPALWEALMAERVRDLRASATPSRRARRTRRHWRASSAGRGLATEGQPGRRQATRPRNA